MTRKPSIALHDLGITGQGPRRVIDMVAIGRVQPVEPVTGRLEGDAEMHGADLAAGKAGDHQQRPAAQERRAVSAMIHVGAAGGIAAATSPVKRVGTGHLTACAIMLRLTQYFHGDCHERALG